MLSAKQSDVVSKRLISLKNDRESSEGRLGAKIQTHTNKEPLMILNTENRSHISLQGTSKLKDLKEEHLKDDGHSFPGIR